MMPGFDENRRRASWNRHVFLGWLLCQRHCPLINFTPSKVNCYGWTHQMNVITWRRNQDSYQQATCTLNAKALIQFKNIGKIVNTNISQKYNDREIQKILLYYFLSEYATHIPWVWRALLAQLAVFGQSLSHEAAQALSDSNESWTRKRTKVVEKKK